jgi:hypothetical protein
MTLQATGMLAIQSLLARASTVGWGLATFYWGIKFGNSAWTKNRLDRHPFTWFAKA